MKSKQKHTPVIVKGTKSNNEDQASYFLSLPSPSSFRFLFTSFLLSFILSLPSLLFSLLIAFSSPLCSACYLSESLFLLPHPSPFCFSSSSSVSQIYSDLALCMYTSGTTGQFLVKFSGDECLFSCFSLLRAAQRSSSHTRQLDGLLTWHEGGESKMIVHRSGKRQSDTDTT